MHTLVTHERMAAGSPHRFQVQDGLHQTHPPLPFFQLSNLHERGSYSNLRYITAYEGRNERLNGVLVNSNGVSGEFCEGMVSDWRYELLFWAGFIQYIKSYMVLTVYGDKGSW